MHFRSVCAINLILVYDYDCGKTSRPVLDRKVQAADQLMKSNVPRFWTEDFCSKAADEYGIFYSIFGCSVACLCFYTAIKLLLHSNYKDEYFLSKHEKECYIF